jgi:hypothetical protein
MPLLSRPASLRLVSLVAATAVGLGGLPATTAFATTTPRAAAALTAAAPEAIAPAVPALVISEIVADNVGYDNFEYFEVLNTSDAAVTIGAGGASFSYTYADCDDRTRDVALSVPAGTSIAAGETVVFWLDYSTTTVNTAAFSVEDFRAYFGATGSYQVVRVSGQAGMANAGGRGIRIVDAASASISWAFYPTGSVGTDTSVTFQTPSSADSVSLAVRTTLDTPTPGSVDPAAFAAEPSEPTPAPTVTPTPTATPTATPTPTPTVTPELPDTRSLIVTEILPDSTGYDNFEYAEVYNASASPMVIGEGGVSLAYSYVDSDDRARDVPLTVPAGTSIAPGETMLFWIDYATTTVDTQAFTVEDFRAQFPAAGDYQVIRVTGQAGLANTGNRGIRLVDPTGAVIGWSYYPTGSVSAGTAAHFGFPADSSAASMTLLSSLAAPSPGAIDFAAVIGTAPQPTATPTATPTAEPTATATPTVAPTPEPTVAPTPQPDPNLVTAPLQITELLPDSTNVGSADGYEFIELYNSTSTSIDFSDYSLKYLYPLADLSNSQTAQWPSTPRDVVIAPGKTLVLWIKNGQNDTLTAADFNSQFGSTLVSGVDLIEIYSAGMANGSARGIEIVTNTGFSLNRAYYNLNGVDDVNANQGIQYALSSTDQTMQSLLRQSAASPGTVTADQVASGLMVVPTDAQDPVVSDSTPAEIDPAVDFSFAVRATDNSQVKTLTLNLRSSADDGYEAINLVSDGSDGYSHTIVAADLTGKRWYDYYLTASDGSQIVSTDVRRLQLSGVDTSPVRMNVTEGQLVSGVIDVSAAGNDVPDSLDLTIDGEARDTTLALETTPYFVFDAGSVNTFFRNGVRIGDDVLTIFQDGIFEGYEPITTAIPLSYITQGEELVVSVWAGTKAAPEIDLNENNDDFSIKNLRLVLPDGRTLRPTGYTDPDAVLKMGDSAGTLDYYDAHFTIPTDAFSAISTTWDTTTTEDGAHTVTATASSGADDDVLTRTVVVDNSAPTVTTSVLNDTEYRGPFTISANATDAGAGVAEVHATLDGWAVELPYITSSVSLASGTHKLEVIATDALGNTGTTTVTFTTPDEQPGTELLSPVDGAILDEGNVDLSATVTDPNDDALDVSFNEGFSLDPSDAAVTSFSGETRVADSTDRTARVLLSGADLEAMTGTNGLATTVTSDSAFPYEMFDVTVPEGSGADFQARLAWAGSANADAKVLMYVLNSATGAWEEVDRYVTTDGAATDFTLDALVPAEAHVADGKMSVLIQHSEGFAGEDLSDRTTEVTPYNAAATDRAAYDFTFAWETDTQYYNAQYYEHQLEIHEFVLDQREELNLQYMFHTGDVVDDSTVEQQWLNATSAYTMLDDAHLPYGVLAGNHDVGQQESDFTAFSKYFGAERYNTNEWYGGDFQDNRGHYDLITAGGMDFVMLYMGWAPTDDAIAWMNQVIQAYPERKVMINLHEFMLTTGGLGPIPQQIMDEVVAPNANVITVFSGHYHDAYTRTDSFDDTGDGIADRTVYSMLFDYQGLPEGGLAYLRLLHFDNDLQQFTVRTYSPYLDDFDSDDASLEPVHQEFVVPYAAFGLTPVTKSLSTDSFTADILTTTEIDSFSEVASGTTLTTAWTDLPVGDHGWYVVSTDPYGAVDYSSVRTLSVVPAPEEPVDPEDPTDPTLPEEPSDPGTPVEPTPGDPATPVAPVADSELTAATRNGVDAPMTASPGEVIRVSVPGHAGETVRIWLQAEGLLLGTVTVDAAGVAVVTIPSDARLGTSRIVVQSLDGSLIGWDGLVLAAAATSTAATSTNATDNALASTGTDVTVALGLGALLLALGAALLTTRRRRAHR